MCVGGIESLLAVYSVLSNKTFVIHRHHSYSASDIMVICFHGFPRPWKGRILKLINGYFEFHVNPESLLTLFLKKCMLWRGFDSLWKSTNKKGRGREREQWLSNYSLNRKLQGLALYCFHWKTTINSILYQISPIC